MIYRYTLSDSPKNAGLHDRVINGIRLRKNFWTHSNVRVDFGGFENEVIEESADSQQEFERSDIHHTHAHFIPTVPESVPAMAPAPVTEEAIPQLTLPTVEPVPVPVKPAPALAAAPHRELSFVPTQRSIGDPVVIELLRRGFSLTELVPLDNEQRQELLELDDSMKRTS